MAGGRQTESLKPIDKAIFGMAASHRAVVTRTRMWPRNLAVEVELAMRGRRQNDRP